MSGSAFLLFGNDVAPQMRDSYEDWHSGHHVPQRLTVPGILGAIRFQAWGGGSPEYLTLYRLAKAGVLESAEYRTLIDHPDESTLAMRPYFRAPVRYVAIVADMPHIPVPCWMRVETSDSGFSGPETDFLCVDGRLVSNQRNHPIMGAHRLPEGYIRLMLAPRDRLIRQEEAPNRQRIGGLYQPLDRFGADQT